MTNYCAGKNCNNGGDCLNNYTASSYQCVCWSGFNGVDCSNRKLFFIKININYLLRKMNVYFYKNLEYFKCLSTGTFADPLYCYKYIICTSGKIIFMTVMK